MAQAPDLRFEFGRNWKQFLGQMNENRIEVATKSLQSMLQTESLTGSRFLDIGSGSGLFSLAASRLGAKVRSFDYDPDSVACTEYLKSQYAPQEDWAISQGSILDPEFVKSLDKYEVVYSWGVLHHTGNLWGAIQQSANLVKPGGLLAISIYNDQGGSSRRWKTIKQVYNRLPSSLKPIMAGLFFLQHETKQALIRLVRLQNPLPFQDWKRKKSDRGMSPWHDTVDWIGGYPFEVAKPEEIFRFLNRQGFELRHLTTQAGGYGCNEFVFEKVKPSLTE